jgi:hypothetical protein
MSNRFSIILTPLKVLQLSREGVCIQDREHEEHFHVRSTNYFMQNLPKDNYVLEGSQES